MNKNDKYIIPIQSTERKKNLVADHTCWCGDDMEVGVILADILNKIGDYKLIGKVNTINYRFDSRINTLAKIKEGTCVSFKYFADLMMKDFKENVIISGFPTDVETHLLNLLTAKYRNKIHRQPKKHDGNN